MQTVVPPNEAERLAALKRYRILDTEQEEAFDRFTKLARRTFDVPISTVTLIDNSRQWFKAHDGLELVETKRDIAFCAHTILHDNVMVVPDARHDSRFRSNPLVVDEPCIRFYAGAPLTTPDGYNIGTLSIIDKKPRPDLTHEQCAILADLAALVVSELELRYSTARLKEEGVERELAMRAAEEASKAKSEFLSRMSHELRTPLTAILGFGQLLQMGDLSEADNDAVSHINKAGQHLLALINDVLDLSRIEAGRVMVSIEPVAVKELVEEVMHLLQHAALQRRVVLDHEAYQSCETLVRADNQRLKQALLNLVSNAIKYNRVGGSVRVSCRNANAGLLRIAVSDTGHGIPADKLERLFQPFERLAAERSEIEGTGLGLALSKQLVEAMGGVVGVESTPGEGSTFWLELPREERQESLKEEAEQPMLAVDDYGSAKHYRALYIEDNLSNLTLLMRILAYRTDLKIMTAMQGRVGLELALAHSPDIILLDLNLPDLQGDEVLRRLRNHSATRHVPVIILSADATPGQIRRLMDQGAYAYLTKPFDIAKIRETVNTILDRD